VAFVFGTSSRVWLDGLDASCNINDVTLEQEVDEAEVTTLCSTIKDYIPGLAEVTLEIEGFYDTNTAVPANTLEAWMESRIGSTFPTVFAPEGGNELGDPLYIMNGFLQEYSIENTVDEAASMEMTLRGTAGLSRGQILAPMASRTTTGDGSPLDGGAASTAGGVAVLSVAGVSGTTPSLTVKIQDTADISGTPVWTDVATFSAVTAKDGLYLELPSNIKRYVRAQWTISGTTPNFQFNVGFKRN
jgi:hypothetical protein